ncbi:MAG: PD40 domain-containing protein [Chloroflexi bacterium]|nr:PD40 domain-containing protein [Chloroflexota bacterium]
MGIITSSADASGPIPFLDQPLTDDYDLLRQQIQAINSAGDSELARGIDLAIASLGEPVVDRQRAIFLVLHDDLPLNDPAIEAIGRTQQTGIDVYMIVNSLNIAFDVQIDQTEAADAVGEEYTLFLNAGLLPDNAQLRQLFIRATQGVVGISGRNLRVREIFAPSGDGPSGDGREILTADQGGQISADTITWDVSQVAPGLPVELSYQIRVPATTTVLNTTLTLGLNYIDCNGYLQSDTLDPHAVELGPTPTPTLTATPTPTSTPLGVVIQPTPGATPTPGTVPFLERILPSSPGRAFCDSSFWWLPALLLPLLVLALWWWWLRSHGSDFRAEIGNMATPRCWPCLLFWLYLLFCFSCGSGAIFWVVSNRRKRVLLAARSGAFEQNGLYLTIPDQTAQEAIPFAAVNNQADCVGCHTVTSTGDAVAVVLDAPPGEVAVHRLDGTRIEIPSIRASFLAWSPDGTQLAYDGEAGDIHVLDLNSGQTRAVQGASEPGITEVMPAWSADGTLLAFVRYEGVVDYPFSSAWANGYLCCASRRWTGYSHDWGKRKWAKLLSRILARWEMAGFYTPQWHNNLRGPGCGNISGSVFWWRPNQIGGKRWAKWRKPC